MSIAQLNKSGRFFAFGCSLTRCIWPTWADILGREFAYYENWARGGSGNQFIFHSLIECHKRNQFTKDDTVIIQWSTSHQEDRYVDDMGGWIGNGALAVQGLYSKEWLAKFSCQEGCLIRDLSLIDAAHQLLEKWGVQYEVMAPILITANTASPAVALYSDLIDSCTPNIVGITTSTLDTQEYNLLFGSKFERKQFYWENEYKQLAGADWPDFENFVHGTYSCSDYIQKELTLFLKQVTHTFHHPTPIDHLQYLNKYFPNITISDDTIKWVTNLRRSISSENEIAYYNSNIPNRFAIKGLYEN